MAVNDTIFENLNDTVIAFIPTMLFIIVIAWIFKVITDAI